MIKNFLSKTSGFTMVELMVAISIIGILSTIVYANFGQARAVARDDIRRTELKNLQLAVELYKAQNGVYPASCNGANWGGDAVSSWACTTAPHIGTNNFILGLTPDYVDDLPLDSRAGNNSYLYRSNGSEYKIMFNGVERKHAASYADEFARCGQGNGTSQCPDAAPQVGVYAVFSNTANAPWW